MKLCELFIEDKITKKMLDDVSKESDYWYQATQFIIDNWSRTLDSLSQRQFSWTHKILEDLVEKRIERKI